MTYTLRSANASPFARKVRIAAAVAGLGDQLELHNVVPNSDDDPIKKQNPLGKLPVLILDDGNSIFDSPVIAEYFDLAAGGGKLIPAALDDRMAALKLQALADGILDAAILLVYEGRYRPDQEPYEPWLDFQRGKIERALAALAGDPPPVEPVNIGTIAVACALGYLDFRKGFDWRPAFPALVPWLEDFAAAVPAFEETRPDA